jgi:hypothetical protein
VSGAQATVVAAAGARAALGRAGISPDRGDDSGTAALPLPRARGEPQDVFSIEAETVQTLVTDDPARTAQVIRGWIAGDRGTLKRAG